MCIHPMWTAWAMVTPIQHQALGTVPSTAQGGEQCPSHTDTLKGVMTSSEQVLDNLCWTHLQTLNKHQRTQEQLWG